MKAKIYINRHVVAANKKSTKETGILLDAPAISINTYLGVLYCKVIEFTGPSRMVQDAEHPACSGATIWMEAEFESLVIDGVAATKSMFKASTIDHS